MGAGGGTRILLLEAYVLDMNVSIRILSFVILVDMFSFNMINVCVNVCVGF